MSCQQDHHRRSRSVTGRDGRTHTKTNDLTGNDALKRSASVSRGIHHRPSRSRHTASSSRHRSSTRARSHSHHSRHSSRRRSGHQHHRRRRSSAGNIRHKSHGRVHHKQNNDAVFIESSLRWHNRLRRRHGARSLQLNNELCKLAQEWANHLASINQLKHSGTKYRGTAAGENLYCQSWPMTGGKESTKAWYAEIENYDFNRGVFSHETGHFTQLVWKGSQEVGFASAKGASMHYAVAMYFPAGNVVGQFTQNVIPASR